MYFDGGYKISFQDGILLHGLLNALQVLPESSDAYKSVWAVVFGGGPIRPGKPGLVDACIAARCGYYVAPENPDAAAFGGSSSAFVDVIPVAGWLRATRPDPFTGIVETAKGKAYVQFMIDALDEKIGPGGVGGRPYFVTYPWRTAHVWDGGMQGRMPRVLAAWEKEPDPTKWYQALGLDPSVYPVAPVPSITSALTVSTQVGQTFAYQITADQTPTAYFASGFPVGLTVNILTGVISGSPTSSGLYPVTIGATNAAGSSSSLLLLTVTPSAGIPVITSALTATAQIGKEFNYAITASQSPTSYSATGLPSGLSVNTVNGFINGSPTSSGIYPVTIAATNANGTNTAVLVISVNSTVNPPVISSLLTVSGKVGSGFLYTITATGSPTSYEASGLPGGLAINASSGQISGVPQSAGSVTVLITARNADGSDTKALNIIIESDIPGSSVGGHSDGGGSSAGCGLGGLSVCIFCVLGVMLYRVPRGNAKNRSMLSI